MIIALCGKKKAGKSTVAGMLETELTHSHMVYTFAFGDILKKICSAVSGMPLVSYYDQELKESVRSDKHGTPREQMFKWERILKDNFGESFFSEVIEGQLKHLADDEDLALLVTDLRFPQEEAMLRGMGAKIIHIVRDTGESCDHPSEAGIPVQAHDIILVNDTNDLMELRKSVRSIVDKLIDTMD